MKIFFSLFALLVCLNLSAQETDPLSQFWNKLQLHCGKAYEGKIIEAPENDSFRGKKLIMHIRVCESDVMKIPFFVGEDSSRTWVLSRKNDRLSLKHDHRHEDGSKDEITNYGGITPNTGKENLQIFPADQETAQLLPEAASNVWWITQTDSTFTYNLKRIGTDRLFSIEFDLSSPIETPAAPWGWKTEFLIRG